MARARVRTQAQNTPAALVVSLVALGLFPIAINYERVSWQIFLSVPTNSPTSRPQIFTIVFLLLEIDHLIHALSCLIN